MAYRIRIYADHEGNEESFQVFGNHECPQEFIAWAKEHLGRDLNEANDHCFGGSEERFIPLPVDDPHSLLECVDAYVSNFIERNIGNPWPHNAFPDMRRMWLNGYNAYPAFELPTAILAANVASLVIFYTLDLQTWLLDRGILAMDFKTRRWKYAEGKKIYIAGY